MNSMHVHHFWGCSDWLPIASSSCSLSAFFGTKGGGSGTWVPTSNVQPFINGCSNWMMIPNLYIGNGCEITKHHPCLNWLFGVPGCTKHCPGCQDKPIALGGGGGFPAPPTRFLDEAFGFLARMNFSFKKKSNRNRGYFITNLNNVVFHKGNPGKKYHRFLLFDPEPKKRWGI